jgi:hypothetical protein
MPCVFRASLLAMVLLATPSIAAAQDQYAAIAYSESKHSYGYAHGFDSRAEAEAAAIKYCEAADAEVVVWARNWWCALALDLDGNARGWAWNARAGGAEAQAFAECQKLCDNCYVAICVHADGTVRKYDPPINPLASMPKVKELPKLPEAFFPSKLP